MENTSNQRKTPFKALFFAVLAVLVLAAGYTIYYLNACNKEIKASSENALAEEFLAIADSTVTGNYTVRIESASDTSRLTGFIDKDSLGSYVLHILSEYEPRIITLQATDSTLFNEELGEAAVAMKKNTGKITIKFEKEGYTCTLTK